MNLGLPERETQKGWRYRALVVGATLALSVITLAMSAKLNAQTIDNAQELEAEVVDRFCSLDGRMHEMTFDEMEAYLHQDLEYDPSLEDEIDDQSLNQSILDSCPEVLIQLEERGREAYGS